jgi:hypothetical protein
MSRTPTLFGIALLIALSNGTLRADDLKIADAVQRGAAYLASTDLRKNGHGLGSLSLAGLALLEADVKIENGVIQSIANAVRQEVIVETKTYQTALSLILLDRVGDPADIGLIQILGARLMASQTVAGGWGYDCTPALEAADVARIRAALASTPVATRERLNIEAARYLAAVAAGQRNASSLQGDDNSNTQFASVALWVARRNGLPVDGALFRLQQRYIRTQSVGNGGWGYRIEENSSTPSMSCAGLLALAAAKAAAESKQRLARPVAPKPDDDDPFFHPPPPGVDRDKDPAELENVNLADPNTLPARERAIDRALTGLGKLLQQPVSVGGGNGAYGGVNDLYFFWSLERVAVAFGLDTVGGVDWYKWGSEAIVASQNPNGSWPCSYDTGTGVISTSFALLFLKKANFTGDLTKQIAGKIKDPGAGELRGGRGSSGGISAEGSPLNRPKRDDPKAEGISKVRVGTEADAIAEGLISASEREWPAKLTAARQTKGAMNTRGLTLALGQLEGKRQFEARQALATRFTRMTQETLKSLVADRDAEVRRAACLAIGMKDDWILLPEVIDCITDPNDLVSRAAKATLKSVSNEDHGPKSGATDIEKREAADAWRLWHAKAMRQRK